MVEKLAELRGSIYEKSRTLAAFFAGIETPVGRMRQLQRGIRVAREHGDIRMSAFLSGLLREMEEYSNLCEALLLEKYNTCTREESTFLILFFRDLVGETVTEVDLHIDLYTAFYGWCKEQGYLAPVDELLLLSLLVTGYGKDEHAWRARSFVGRLGELLKESYQPKEMYFVAMAHRAIADFYCEVHDVRRCFAARVACSQVEMLLGRVEDSAAMLADAYALTHTLPALAPLVMDDDSIREAYGETADIVLRYKTPRLIKVDPVEHTEAFLAAFDEVMEWVEARRTQRGFGACHELWSLMQDGFALKGIRWKSPREMNPRVMFD